MPSSPMLLKECLMQEAQPPIAGVAEEIATKVVEQIEVGVWGAVKNPERRALEVTHPDSALVLAIPVKLR